MYIYIHIYIYIYVYIYIYIYMCVCVCVCVCVCGPDPRRRAQPSHDSCGCAGNRARDRGRRPAQQQHPPSAPTGGIGIGAQAHAVRCVRAPVVGHRRARCSRARPEGIRHHSEAAHCHPDVAYPVVIDQYRHGSQRLTGVLQARRILFRRRPRWLCMP